MPTNSASEYYLPLALAFESAISNSSKRNDKYFFRNAYNPYLFESAKCKYFSNLPTKALAKLSTDKLFEFKN